MFPVFFLSKKPDRPTYLHTSRVDDNPVPVTKSKIHSHWGKKQTRKHIFPVPSFGIDRIFRCTGSQIKTMFSFRIDQYGNYDDEGSSRKAHTYQ